MSRTRILVYNVTFLLLVVISAFLVDGNGRIAGLPAGVSLLVAFLLFAGAFLFAGILVAIGNMWMRGLGVLLILFYLVALFPSISLLL